MLSAAATFDEPTRPFRIRRRWLNTLRRGVRKTALEYQVCVGTEIVDRFDFLEAAIDQYPKARIDRQLFRGWRA